MSKSKYTPEKRSYVLPTIECIVLDNEISLQLTSNSQPTGEPDNWSLNAPEYFNSDPFKNTIA